MSTHNGQNVYKMFGNAIFKSVAPLLTCFCLFTTAFGQHQTDNWLFGRGAGLQFRAGVASPLYGSRMNQTEGVATISDRRTGQLLFYSDGINVWSSNNQIMPNGRNLFGSQTSTQSALIVPFPGKESLYYLFTTRAFNDGAGGLYYSVIDMNLNNGLGDIINNQKNILLEQRSTEKLTAVPHADKKNFWIISHKWDSDIFLVYLLTNKGITATQEIHIGTKHQAGIVGGSEAMGYLKASPDSRKIAAAVYGDLRPFELYDFNNQTGYLSNYQNLGDFKEQYGVSFSGDNTKLYLSGIGYDSGAYQFDLTDNSPPTILRMPDSLNYEKYNIFVSGSLQLGIDGRLYSSTERGNLIVIQYPNKKGVACQPEYANFNFESGKPFLGLPNFIQAFFDSTYNISPTIPVEPICSHTLNIYPNPISAGTLSIILDSSSCVPLNLCVYDLQGRLIDKYSNIVGRVIPLDVSWWAAGLYVIVFNYENNKIVKKVIKL